MNRNILTFLNEYAEIPDPQYAIMLRGAWGCGKTFFIRQWMEQLKNNRDADKLKWQPIYVSLYGLTTTQQITEQINKEISPWLYSKGMKLAKNVLKVASKIALKYDIDGDGKDEGSVTCDLDSILLLKEENSEIKGNKILIFDDLERCDVKLETLLGYINYFSEHCKCKVIIIGDENKISEKEDDKCKLKFKDFKEKTIGRTFEIKVNIEETLDFFIGEISANNRNLLSENKELIIKIFQASKFDNLRVLRQCLNDYHRIIMALPEHYHESPKYKLIITSLLANFVAVYCEYKGGNTEIASLFNSLYNMFPDKEKNEEREKILSKYRFIEIGKRLDIFSDFIVNEIVCYLESGYFDTTYLQQYFAAEDVSLNSWDYLYDYWRLDNEEYEKHYEETVRYYFADKSVDLKELFVIISILSVLYSDNLVHVSEEDIIAQGKHSIDRLMEGINDMEGLLNCSSKVHAGARRNHSNIGSDRILNVLVGYYQTLFEQRLDQCPNKVSVMLEDLMDETCERLNLALNDVIPVKQRLYRDTSIFQEADADKVSKSILGLSNESRNTFLHFLQSRYKYTSYGTEIEYLNECCQSDLPQLKLINEKKFFPIKTTIFVHKENSYYTMNHTVEDLSLFNALRQGDGNSFDHLFRRYYPMLCAYAHRLVSLEDAEEIVQEVMLWLWENRGDLIIESSLNQYLFKMTYRRVLNHLTREQVKTKAEAAFYERTQAALCEVDYGRFEELDRKIKEAMAALPDSYREAFVMHRFKELSYKEIAEVLDVSPQTVAYRIQQALKLLRVSLKDYLPMLVWLVG